MSQRPPQYKVENTQVKVYVSSSKGYKPLLLKDCMAPSLFFTKIVGTWPLLDDNIKQLHITFPWLPKENKGRLMILDRENVNAGLECIRDEVESAPCWAEERGRCSIHVMIIMPSSQTAKHAVDEPTARDGRSVLDMSVNANRV